MRAACLALTGVLLSCAATRGREEAPAPVTPAALIASVAPEEAFRAQAPGPGPATALPEVSLVTSVLPNGLTLVVVERHSFPTVGVEMVFPYDPVDAAGGARLGRVGYTFLSPIETGQDASASCGRSGCTLSAAGAVGELGDTLDRIASLAVGPREGRDVYTRRFTAYAQNWDGSRGSPQAAIQRNAHVLAFGRAMYGEASEPDPVDLKDLDALRATVLSPKNATLVVAGDVRAEDVRALVEQRFAGWRGDQATAQASGAGSLERPGAGPRVAFMQHTTLTQVYGAVVARGPAPGDADAAAFAVACVVLGGGFGSAAFHHVREELRAAYTVGASVEWYRSGSVVMLGGAFEADKAVDAMQMLLEVTRALRDFGPSAVALARAKALIAGAWRMNASTSLGVASSVAGRVLLGYASSDPLEWQNQIAALTAVDVQRAAQTYFAESLLGLIAVGRGDGAWMRAFGRGTPVLRDGFGRDVAGRSPGHVRQK